MTTATQDRLWTSRVTSVDFFLIDSYFKKKEKKKDFILLFIRVLLTKREKPVTNLCIHLYTYFFHYLINLFVCWRIYGLFLSTRFKHRTSRVVRKGVGAAGAGGGGAEEGVFSLVALSSREDF